MFEVWGKMGPCHSICYLLHSDVLSCLSHSLISYLTLILALVFLASNSLISRISYPSHFYLLCRILLHLISHVLICYLSHHLLSLVSHNHSFYSTFIAQTLIFYMRICHTHISCLVHSLLSSLTHFSHSAFTLTHTRYHSFPHVF